MHIKLHYVVIVVPALAAVCVSLYVNGVREKRNAAIAAYIAGSDYSPLMMLSAFGPDECRRRMVSLAGSTSGVVFDGKDRWVKIVKTPQQFGPGCGEGLLLFSLADGSARNEVLPAGGVITDIAFSDDTLIVRAYGYFDHGSSAYRVPKESPIEIRLDWPAGAPPSPANLAKLSMGKYMLWYRVK